MRKKHTSTLLAALLACTTAACNASKTPDTTEPDKEQPAQHEFQAQGDPTNPSASDGPGKSDRAKHAEPEEEAGSEANQKKATGTTAEHKTGGGNGAGAGEAGSGSGNADGRP